MLTLTVGVKEKQKEDRESPAEAKQVGETLLVDTVDVGTLVDTGVQVDEDSLLGVRMDETGLSMDEENATDSVLLCILGELNGIKVTFLIDSGASECFLSIAFVEKNNIKTRKKRKNEYSVS